ncbi:hypothetical protein N656DRAFT_608115 [Canariomyces notabilis]|uniref:Uncharacterized protein n=1 Tax=Canariomyces notabilis TaxID=2074819 RepID=A0AAN6YTX9_9PEZI|nr:hypothetical protein N656DRAFT_608115 [Canariomyces arenarius]
MTETGRVRRSASKMVNSLVWTAEEAKFLKAVLRWQASAPPSEDEKRRRLWAEEDAMRRRRQQQQAQAKPVGEFRVLVIGGRGTGKTAILTRFGQDTFRGESGSPDPFYEHGCRHPITLSTTTTTNTKTNQLHSPTQPQTQTYMVDALEMPSKQLVSNPMIEQALAITEAAVLVYDVCDAASFRLAQNLAEFMREHFTASSSSPPGATPAVKAASPGDLGRRLQSRGTHGHARMQFGARCGLPRGVGQDGGKRRPDLSGGGQGDPEDEAACRAATGTAG